MKKLNSIKIKVIGILLLLLALTLFKLLQRETYTSNEKVVFYTNESVIVNYQHSDFKWYGRFHYGIGLESPKYKLKFIFKKRDYLWKSKFVPKVLNCFNSNIYIIAFDRFTNFNKIIFRYYKFDKKWIEIEPKEFPKSIAIQNIGLEKENGFINGKALNEYEMIRELDTSFGPFQRSLTAKIWFELETGTKYYDSPNRVNEGFLQKFKSKYISSNINSNKILSKKYSGSGSDAILGGTSSKYASIKKAKTHTNTDIDQFFYFLILLVFLMIIIFSIRFLCGKLIKNTNDPRKIMRINGFQLYFIIASIVSFIYLMLFDFIVALIDMAF